MTRHKHAHTGLVTPSPLDHWIDATLRVFAMLVLHVASTLQMICRRRPVIGTQAMPSALPEVKTDTQSKEPNLAVQPDSSPKALILRDRMHDVRTADLPRAIVSKDEGVLTTLSPSFLRKQESRGPEGSACSPWLPARRYASSGMTTVGLLEVAQHARSLTNAPPHLRSSRRKSGPRASWVMCVQTGLHQQPWVPACAGTSGTRPAKHALN